MESVFDNDLCLTEGCARPPHARGFCKNHYQAWWAKNRDALCCVLRCGAPVHAKDRCDTHYRQWLLADGANVCTVIDADMPCGVTAIAKGMCSKHYQRAMKYGDPHARREVIPKPDGWSSWTLADQRRWRRHNITPTVVEELRSAQNERCPCGALLCEGFEVDHDHTCCPGAESCGRCARGLLCSRHNKVLGLCGDDPDVLEALAAYIRRYKKKEVPTHGTPEAR